MWDILTAHPEVAGIYESWIFTKKHGIGSLFAGAHWPSGHSGLGRLLDRAELIREVRDLILRLFSRSLQPHHRFLVEKSPSHLFAIELIDELFPDCRIVHVLRDGRDVCVSVRAAARSWMPDWGSSFGRSVYTSARSWRDAVMKVGQHRARLGDRFLEIRYETIKQDPIGSYRRLFKFCRIPYDEGLLNHIYARTDFDKNFVPNEAGFRRQGQVGAWRKSFNLIDCVVFNLVAGQALIDTGYETSRRWW